MRIISGIYGRRRFDVPSSFSARPTTDFAKENIFNVVNNLVDLEGMDALDLFAGTGSISFELISRGCRNATAIEKQVRERDYTICPCMRGLSCVRATLRAGTRRVAIHT